VRRLYAAYFGFFSFVSFFCRERRTFISWECGQAKSEKQKKAAPGRRAPKDVTMATMLRLLESLGRFLAFAGGALVAAVASLRRPAEVARQLYLILLGSLPLGFIAGVALGVVVWMHLNGVVERAFAAKVPEYLALVVALEFAPLGAGMVVAGRCGASLGAELSSMRLTEQIDALEAMGLPAMGYLVGPRTMAAMIALPLLTIYLAVFALGSSFLAEMAGGSMFASQYQLAIERGLAHAKIVPATLKTVAFGYLIAVAGCWHGLHAPPGAEGVGKAATRGVVLAIQLVLASNVLLVKLIQLY
jgi:phospholipid/cholesterol/gamma-HCH transport system permease protein